MLQVDSLSYKTILVMAKGASDTLRRRLSKHRHKYWENMISSSSVSAQNLMFTTTTTESIQMQTYQAVICQMAQHKLLIVSASAIDYCKKQRNYKVRVHVTVQLSQQNYSTFYGEVTFIKSVEIHHGISQDKVYT